MEPSPVTLQEDEMVRIQGGHTTFVLVCLYIHFARAWVVGDVEMLQQRRGQEQPRPQPGQLRAPGHGEARQLRQLQLPRPQLGQLRAAKVQLLEAAQRGEGGARAAGQLGGHQLQAAQLGEAGQRGGGEVVQGVVAEIQVVEGALLRQVHAGHLGGRGLSPPPASALHLVVADVEAGEGGRHRGQAGHQVVA